MTKLLFLSFIFTTVFYGCSNQTTTDKSKTTTARQQGETIKYSGLQGTWVRQNKVGFTLIEIKDTSNVIYYQFLDRETDLGACRPSMTNQNPEQIVRNHIDNHFFSVLSFANLSSMPV